MDTLPALYTQKETEAHQTRLVEAIRAAISPPSPLPAWQWCEKNITLDGTGPVPGRYNTDLTPAVRWLYDAGQDPRVRRIVAMLSAQSAKTQFALNHMCWAAAEDPAPAMWVGASADNCEEFAKKRLVPALENCEATARLLPRNRARKTQRLIQLDSMNLMLRGSNSRVGLQSDPVRRIYCDERREWKPGAIDLLRKRTRTFHNFQEISLGTAGKDGDELHNDWREGSQTEPHFRCPHCNRSQPFRFGREPTPVYRTQRPRGGLVWKDDDTTKPGGKWDFAAVRATVRLECEECGALFTSAQKFELLKSLHPVDYNPAAPPQVRSFHWNALSMPWSSCDWGEIVVEFLKARDAAAAGNLEPLKTFVTETLGEPWEDHLGEIEDFGFIEARRAAYLLGDPWPQEITRFMAADRQEAGGEHYWWAIRAFGPAASSRLIAYGRCSSQKELEELRTGYKVPAGNAVIDSGDRGTLVYKFAMATGWKPFKGDAAPYFIHHELDAAGNKRAIRRLWHMTRTDPAIGTREAGRQSLRLYRWSGDATKDLLAEHMRGLVGDWTLAEGTPRDYLQQVTAERRVERVDNYGRLTFVWKRIRRDNHLFDCECMLLAAAVISKVINEPAQQHVRNDPGPPRQLMPAPTLEDCRLMEA